jgi:hypothetical protein
LLREAKSLDPSLMNTRWPNYFSRMLGTLQICKVQDALVKTTECKYIRKRHHISYILALPYTIA